MHLFLPSLFSLTILALIDSKPFLMLELIPSPTKTSLLTRPPDPRLLRLRKTHKLNSSLPSRLILIKSLRTFLSESHSPKARETTTPESSAPRLPTQSWTTPQTFWPPLNLDLRKLSPSKTLLISHLFSSMTCNSKISKRVSVCQRTENSSLP